MLPVIDQGSRAHGQGGLLLSPFVCVLQKGDDLKGFAQAHVIRQDPAKAIAVQCLKPAISNPLILPEDPALGFGHRVVAVLHGLDPPDHGF